MLYEKPFLTFDQQAELIQGRGLGGDRKTLLFALETIGYYRLSGYWHIFHTENVFHDGATIEKVLRIYDFDRQFRLIVLNAIEHIEIYFRTQLSHQLADRFGPFGYQDHSCLPRLSDKDYSDFLKKCHSCFGRSREPFVIHYQKVYGNNDKDQLPPLWMMANVMDFGGVVSMYRGAPVELRNKLASKFQVSAKVLESWLLSINTVRNICAHHGRLWNRVVGTKPKIPHDAKWHHPYEIETNRIGSVLAILKFLTDEISPDSHWVQKLHTLMGEYPDIKLTSMGLNEGWKESPLWK